MDVRFLKTTVLEAPGVPLVDVTFRPGTLPASAEIKLSLPDSVIVAPLTTWTDEPTDRAIRFIPNSAVITTSPSEPPFGTSVTLKAEPDPTRTVCGSKLTWDKSNSFPLDARMVNE